MKNLVTMFIALITLVTFPTFASTKADTALEELGFTNMANSRGYSVSGYSTHTFTEDINRGHVDVLITGDGSTDLDLYVYIGGRWLSSESNSDDEKICLGQIMRSGYIKIMVVNRGAYRNDYQLTIK